MGKIIRLNESELVSLIQRIIIEQTEESVKDLVGTTVKCYDSIEQKGFMDGVATIKSATKDGEDKINMDIEYKLNTSSHMPNRPPTFYGKLIYDCNKEGFEITFTNKKPKMFFNKKFENFIQKYCSNPKQR